MTHKIFAAQECQISLSEPIVDFGRVIRPGSNDLSSANTIHSLGKRIINLTASCPQSANLVVLLRGAGNGDQFRFAQRGQLGVTVSNASLDGRSVSLVKKQPIGAPPDSSGSSIQLNPGDRVTAVSGGSPIEGSVLSMQIELTPQLPISELRTRDAKT